MSAPAPITDPVPRTLMGLQHWVANSFHCMMGPPSAYFELAGPDQRFRCRYETLGFSTLGHRADVESDLVAAMHALLSEQLKKLEARDEWLILFWRRVLVIEEVMVRDKVGTSISCRVWISGVDLTPYSKEAKLWLDM